MKCLIIFLFIISGYHASSQKPIDTSNLYYKVYGLRARFSCKFMEHQGVNRYPLLNRYDSVINLDICPKYIIYDSLLCRKYKVREVSVGNCTVSAGTVYRAAVWNARVDSVLAERYQRNFGEMINEEVNLIFASNLKAKISAIRKEAQKNKLAAKETNELIEEYKRIVKEYLDY